MNWFLVFIGVSALTFVELWIAEFIFMQFGLIMTIIWLIISVIVFLGYIHRESKIQ